MIRDSLGVPQEPPYEKPVAKDWLGEDLYRGEYVYVTDEGEFIKEDDIMKWIDWNMDSKIMGE